MIPDIVILLIMFGLVALLFFLVLGAKLRRKDDNHWKPDEYNPRTWDDTAQAEKERKGRNGTV